MGFIFHGFSIFADFVFFNSQLLAIVPYVSIDALCFVDETSADLAADLQTLNPVKIKVQKVMSLLHVH